MKCKNKYMAICPSSNFKLPPIDEVPCFAIERPKTKYRGNAKYIGVTGMTDNGKYIHQFQLENNIGLIQSILPDESIEGLNEGQEIEVEFEV